jgi:hypothetical protein
MTNFDRRTVAVIFAAAVAALPTSWARAEPTSLADTQLAQAGDVRSASPFQATGPLAGVARLPGAGPIYGVAPLEGVSPKAGAGPRGKSGVRNSGETIPRE